MVRLSLALVTVLIPGLALVTVLLAPGLALVTVLLAPGLALVLVLNLVAGRGEDMDR